jgi:Mrp family chromosome partitioning ATPase
MSKNFELLQQEKIDTPPAEKPEAYFYRPNGNGQNGHPEQLRLNLDGVAREETLRLIHNVFLLQGQNSPRVVAFAGIDSEDGCSRICGLSARLLADQKVGSVCVVDANLHSPSMARVFGVTNNFGLTDALREQGPVRQFVKQLQPDNLWLLSAGSAVSDSLSLVNSSAMQTRIHELRQAFNYVIVDAPPVNAYADGIALGKLADGLVLVLEANATRRETAARVADTLRKSQVRIVGAVLDKRTFPIPQALYHRI